MQSDENKSDLNWRAFKKGDKEAFAAIYKQHVKDLLTYGYKVTSDRKLIEDSVQDLFFELWKNRSGLSHTDSVRFYLFRALRLIDYTQRPVPNDFDGTSLLPIIQSEIPDRGPVFIQYDGNGSLGNFQRCVVSDEYKLTVDIFKDEAFLELYHLGEDPAETRNLAFETDYREKTFELLLILSSIMRESGDRLKLPDDLYARFQRDYENLIQE